MRAAALSSPRRVLAAALAAAFTGCATVGPDYREPKAAVPASWSAVLPRAGSLQSPNDWRGWFDDPVLSRLQQTAADDNPTLAVAWANIELARATLSAAGSGWFPSASVDYARTRSRVQGTRATDTRVYSGDVSWELDLFGKVARGVEAAEAQVAGRRNDWHEARLSLAAEVATMYVQFRSCRLLADTYAQAAHSNEDTVRYTESLLRAGLAPSADASLARATWASTSATLAGQRAQCALLVKSLGRLTGLQEGELRALLDSGTGAPPAPREMRVDRLPADMVRQRPDIASRERDLAAASANIGVAQADLYPKVRIAGSISSNASLTSWSFGPSLSLPVFDGGARTAAVASARANYELAYAHWRAAVRDAVADVEQALVQLDGLTVRILQAEEAAREYRRFLTSADAQRRAGLIDLLTFEDTRRLSLTAEVSLLELQRDRLVAWITLYRALGGGWQADLPVDPPTSRAPELHSR